MGDFPIQSYVHSLTLSASKDGCGCKCTWKTIQFYTKVEIKVEEKHCYCRSTFPSHNRVFNNVHVWSRVQCKGITVKL
jgi:hypothetical protein